jgi:hypothetical protein
MVWHEEELAEIKSYVSVWAVIQQWMSSGFVHTRRFSFNSLSSWHIKYVR